MAIKNLLEDYSAMKAEFQKKAKVALHEEFKNFFESYPEIKSIVWNQYTPYFNDGEECVFSVNSASFTNITDTDMMWELSLGDVDTDELEEAALVVSSYDASYLVSDDLSSWGKERKADIIKQFESAGVASLDRMVEISNAVFEFNDIISDNNMEDVMRDTFGDHVMIMATIDGFNVEEFDHD